MKKNVDYKGYDTLIQPTDWRYSAACIGLHRFLTYSGNGILVVGLASVIIGEAIMGKRGVTLGLISAIVGSVIYRFIITWVINSGIFTAQVIRLITAIIVAVALSIPAFKYYIARFKIKHGGGRNA